MVTKEMVNMKLRNYEQVTDKSIVEVKRYLLDHSQGCYQQDIYDIMNASIDIDKIRMYFFIFLSFFKNNLA